VFTHRALLNDDRHLCLGIEPGAVHHRRQLKGSARGPSPERGQNSAQGFNPGLGVLMRCALKGHQNAACRVEFISPQKRSVLLAPLSGRILGWRIPRVETLG
jgi:hypothetical protein